MLGALVEQEAHFEHSGGCNSAALATAATAASRERKQH